MVLAAALLALHLNSKPFTIVRDGYGVPLVRAATPAAAIEGQGYADAQDRLWQMDLSRHLSEGRLAELIGEKGVASDTAIDKTGYTKQEVLEEIANLPPKAKSWFNAYTTGVNLYIHNAEKYGSLPPEYAAAKMQPEPWTAYDSAAISIHLLQLFGQGGAGEIRDLALIDYLKGRSTIGDQWPKVFNDIAFLSDPASIPTVAPKDDPTAHHHPAQFLPTDAQTQAELKALPNTSLFELLPGVSISEQAPAKLIAEKLAVPYRTGSYCVVVAPKRSATHRPLLLSGPQMGFSNPSIDHESAMRAPGLNVSGMDVPGIPGILVGATNKFVWGITSGVADVEDVFVYHSPDRTHYQFDGKTKPLQEEKFTIHVRGGTDQTVTQTRTPYGPVIINSPSSHAIYALRTAYRGQELNSLADIYDTYAASTPATLQAETAKVAMSFNFFYATTSGHIGWRYCGHVPMRAAGLDPRLPTLATPANNWRGFIPADEMPHVLDPSAGIIANWNNKPASWWLNGDTPVWGEVFHNRVLLAQIKKPLLTRSDLHQAAIMIARTDDTWPYFASMVKHADPNGPLASWDGLDIDGSHQAGIWQATLEGLRQSLFLHATGNFLSDSYFDLIVQPNVVLHALRGDSHFDYRSGKSASAILSDALAKAAAAPPFVAGRIHFPGDRSILYSNRGTYIQLVSLGADGLWHAMSILPPGEAESGPHQFDQVPISASFGFKPSQIGKK